MSENDTPQNFPDFDENEDRKESKKGSKLFINSLYPNDSLTVCDGFINEIREHKKNDKKMYFLSVGLIQGSIHEGNDYKGDITNCDLLAGSTLEKLSSSMKDNAELLKGIRFSLEIRNLKFVPKIHDNKPYMDSRGILETIKIGKINR